MVDPGHNDESANLVPAVSDEAANDDGVELTYSAEDVIKKYLALRATVKAIKKRHAAELEPYTAAMNMLENYAAVMMRRLKSTLSTPFGSAFWVRNWSYKVNDFDKFYDWVVKNKQKYMFTRHVSQDAINDWIAVQKAQNADPNAEIKLPDGVISEYDISVQFRKG